MLPKKRNSSALKRLKICLDFLKTRDEAFLQKYNISIEAGERLKTEFEAKLNEYNLSIDQLEAKRQKIERLKKQLQELSNDSRTTVKSDNEDNPNQPVGATPTHSRVKTIQKKDK
jgi:hypothetical protein